MRVYFLWILIALVFAIMDRLGVVSTVVPDSAHKLFIGGLPNYLNDDQVGVSHFWKKQFLH